MFASLTICSSVPLIAAAVSTIGTRPGALYPELETDIRKVMRTVLTLTMVTIMTESGIMAWQTMVGRNVWLHMCQLPLLIRQGGTISSNGLFGPLLRNATAHVHGADRVKKRHTSLSTAAPQPCQHHQDDCCRKRCPAATAAPARTSAAAPPPPLSLCLPLATFGSQQATSC